MEQSGALLSSTLRHGLKCTLITEHVWSAIPPLLLMEQKYL